VEEIVPERLAHAEDKIKVLASLYKVVSSRNTAAASMNFSPLVPQFAWKGYCWSADGVVWDAGGRSTSSTIVEKVSTELGVQPPLWVELL